jgi:hypothetical protein
MIIFLSKKEKAGGAVALMGHLLNRLLWELRYIHASA